MKHFTLNKIKTIFLFASFFFLLYGCESEPDLEIRSQTYTTGGIGTSSVNGAILFSFNIPSYYLTSYVRIVLHDGNNSTRTSYGAGYKEVRFSNLEAKSYDYSLEFWTESDNDQGAYANYTFQNGKLINTSSGSFVNYNQVLNKTESINGTVTAKANQTLKIDVKLD
ncbi:hypothetical protein JL193_05500 [Polaribacter batillariae]|uniref:Lipoprotein n=1 Tax=Polaribacter batillariae TaxID=2808900 RepID=A0ABX7SYZ9_9FLAO|nr:hypothetical protein [Polaribacter batillariae]QTD38723.1 hypothetical protein JL193_05500 [Polaribacter batillariae]